MGNIVRIVLFVFLVFAILAIIRTVVSFYWDKAVEVGIMRMPYDDVMSGRRGRAIDKWSEFTAWREIFDLKYWNMWTSRQWCEFFDVPYVPRKYR